VDTPQSSPRLVEGNAPGFGDDVAPLPVEVPALPAPALAASLPLAGFPFDVLAVAGDEEGELAFAAPAFAPGCACVA
jgi:hypothetical protein